jgi:hypothetical protein
MISGFLEIEVNKSKDRIRKVKKGLLFDVCFSGGGKNWLTYWRDPDWRFFGVEDFVREHGRTWPPQQLPPGYKLMKLGHCGRNASRLALRDPELTYVEGFAVPNFFIGQVNYLGHSWVADPEGRVIDPTWPEGGSEYFGVPFETDYVRGIGKGKPISTLLDRWWDEFPLLRVLGTRPAIWRSKRFAEPDSLKPLRRKALL